MRRRPGQSGQRRRRSLHTPHTHRSVGTGSPCIGRPRRGESNNLTSRFSERRRRRRHSPVQCGRSVRSGPCLERRLQLTAARAAGRAAPRRPADGGGGQAGSGRQSKCIHREHTWSGRRRGLQSSPTVPGPGDGAPTHRARPVPVHHSTVLPRRLSTGNTTVEGTPGEGAQPPRSRHAHSLEERQREGGRERVRYIYIYRASLTVRVRVCREAPAESVLPDACVCMCGCVARASASLSAGPSAVCTCRRGRLVGACLPSRTESLSSEPVDTRHT